MGKETAVKNFFIYEQKIDNKMTKWENVGFFFEEPKSCPNISGQFTGCGKRLWISLWRMWKSIGFQQVFAVLAAASGLCISGREPKWNGKIKNYLTRYDGFGRKRKQV